VSREALLQAQSDISTLMQGLEVFCSSHAATSVEHTRGLLGSALKMGKTYALVGASGVGKSTLVNALLGEQVQETGAVREGDKKGRHVTTFRELFPLANGSLLMDTPGVREFGLWSHGEGLSEVFSDIVELERECRFADCQHDREPGCAVTGAVEQGALSERRLEHWRCLSREIDENRERRDNREARRARSTFRRKVQRDKRFRSR